VNHLWLEARDLTVGTFLYANTSEDKRIIEVSVSIRKETVYDLSVEQNHNFYVSADNVLVHNISPCEKAAQALSRALPNACKVKFACTDFTVRFEKLLLNKKMKGTRLCLKSSNGLIASLSNGNISTNGLHVAVQVGDLVFDNIFPEGKPFSEWIDDVGVGEHPGDIKIDLTKENMTGEFDSGCIPRK